MRPFVVAVSAAVIVVLALVLGGAVAFDIVIPSAKPKQAQDDTLNKAAAGASGAGASKAVSSSEQSSQPAAIVLANGVSRNDDGDLLFPIELSLDGGVTFITRDHLEYAVSRKGDGRVRKTSYDWSEAQIEAFRALVESNGLYMLRVPASLVAMAGPRRYVTSSVPACALAASHFRERLTLHSDDYGTLHSLEIGLTSYDCPASLRRLGSTISVKCEVHMARPTRGPVASVPSEREVLEQQARAAEDNRGFLSRYWMYIVPAVLAFLVMNMVAPPDEGEGAAGAGGANQ